VSEASYWDDIYMSRRPDDVGWYEPDPVMSRTLVGELISAGATSIIDVGGGASSLVDHLLDSGVERITVLDVSAAGLDVAKRRLGERANLVEWIVGDVTASDDVGEFDVWHDRAVFHFLTEETARRRYVQLAEHSVRPGGAAIMATFAPDGPERCSGLNVRRCGARQLAMECGPGFELVASERHVHATPRGVLQNFLYSVFHRVPDRDSQPH
jgi:SAM-dependent methyltransferase